MKNNCISKWKVLWANPDDHSKTEYEIAKKAYKHAIVATKSLFEKETTEIFFNEHKTLRSLYRSFRKPNGSSANIDEDFVKYFQKLFNSNAPEIYPNINRHVQSGNILNIHENITDEEITKVIKASHSRAKCKDGYSSHDLKELGNNLVKY